MKIFALFIVTGIASISISNEISEIDEDLDLNQILDQPVLPEELDVNNKKNLLTQSTSDQFRKQERIATYCQYPRLHISTSGYCPSDSQFNFYWKGNAGKKSNYRERYINHLFEQAYLKQPKAQFRLGVRYQNGIGLPKDIILSYAWFKVALHYGYKSASYTLDQITDQMNAYELQQGDKKTTQIIIGINKSIVERNQWIRDVLTRDYTTLQESEVDHP